VAARVQRIHAASGNRLEISMSKLLGPRAAWRSIRGSAVWLIMLKWRQGDSNP
jgi:hypothetical protein